MHVDDMCKLSYTFATPSRPKLTPIGSACLRAARRRDEEAEGAESLSPSARAMFAMITLAAEADEPCPSNRALASALGFGSEGHVPAVLNRIQAAGLIRIERGRTSRIVTILASGKRTAGEPGQAHWRHRPGSEKRRSIRNGDGRPRKRTEREAAPGALPARIAREPCFYCGVRADIGCVHRPRARDGSRSAPKLSRTSGGRYKSEGN